MTYEVVSVLCGGTGFTAPGDINYRQLDNRCNHYSPCQMYQKALETSKADVIMYAHDDLVIHNPFWVSRVLRPFKEDDVVAVGLGGAVGLGSKDMYKKPYQIEQLARRGYMSNQDDAEVHGSVMTEETDAVVLDAFFIAVRREFLEWVGGWPVEHITHHCLDTWLACILARTGYRTVVTGISCLHKGGGTSIKPSYPAAKWLQGGSVDADHAIPHRWIYDEFRDVLPLEVV